MPDEDVTPAEPEVNAEEAKPVEEVKVDERPHPLAPGGERFSEVYRDMQEARRELARVQGELSAFRTQQTQTTKQPPIYTPQQLQAMVDNGQISQAVMADQLAWQRAQEMRIQTRNEMELVQRNTSALNEVHSYMDKIPALNNIGSNEFQKVKRAAADISSEMQLDITDPRVQRRALREVFGSLDRVKATTDAAEHARERGSRFTGESGGGGGSQAQEGAKAADPLKNVSAAYKEHWKRLGYTEAQMIEEAKFVNREPVVGTRHISSRRVGG